MFKTIKNTISVTWTLFRFFFIKLMRWNGFFYTPVERFSPATMINIHRGGKMELGNRLRVHSGSRLSVTNGAFLSIGDNTAINYNCIFVARKSIYIGKDCTFGPNVVIYDHDHDFRHSKTMNGTVFIEEEIRIGDNVWIGANCIILKGSIIGDNSVIAAGTVVRGEIPSNSVAYNKKEIEIKSYI